MNPCNRDKVDSFWRKRAKIKDSRISTHFKNDDTHVFDLELIKKYCTVESNVLDVACGTCYLSNELVDYVKHIKAFDKFPEFLRHCKANNKFIIEAADILDYEDDDKYNIILMFGIIMYFNDNDTKKIYEKYSNMLSEDGVLIVKHQCGNKEDVTIDKYSDHIQDHYHAVYKSVEKDKILLKNYFRDIEIIDVYPPRLNPWPDTHFFAFICSDLIRVKDI